MQVGTNSELYDLFAALRSCEPGTTQAAVRSWVYRQDDITPAKKSDDGTLIFLVNKNGLDGLVARFKNRKRSLRVATKRDYNSAGDKFAAEICEANVKRARTKREAAEELEHEIAEATKVCEKRCMARWAAADKTFNAALDAATHRCKDAALSIS